jgi:hypothetical protein
LKTDHVRSAELVVQLRRKLLKLRDLRDRPGSQVQEFWDLLEKKAHYSNRYHFQHAAKQLNDWVLGQLRADLVYLLIYDARHDIFRAMGISSSPALFQRWLDNSHELEDVLVKARGKVDCKPVEELLRRVFRTGETTVPQQPDDPVIDVLRPFLHRIMEHSIIARLRPRGSSTRSRGLTWQILNGTKRPRFYHTKSGSDIAFHPATAYYSQVLYPRLFATDNDARADGVLWIGWCEPPNHVSLGSDNRLTDPELEERIQTVEQAMAAIFSLYQYYDSDDAHHPLPFQLPKGKTSRR